MPIKTPHSLLNDKYHKTHIGRGRSLQLIGRQGLATRANRTPERVIGALILQLIKQFALLYF